MGKRNTIDEKVLQRYASLLVEKMKGFEQDWQKPWTPARKEWVPQNMDGRRYNGMNLMLLSLLTEMNGYTTPAYATFKQVKDLGASVRKGMESFPVTYWIPTHWDKDGRMLDKEDYENLSEEEKRETRLSLSPKYYNVFNLDQTNIREVKPELWQKIQDRFRTDIRDDRDMYTNPLLDYMIDNATWVCPVNRVAQDRAFYSIARDEITVPLKGQFDKGEEFYGTLLHEMAHSTGAKGRLDREFGTAFGDDRYAREELVAELSSAVTSSTLGISKGIDPNNVAYLKGWMDTITNDYTFLNTVIKDVTKASNMIMEKVDCEQARNEIVSRSVESINGKLEANRKEREAVKVPLYRSMDEVGVSIRQGMAMEQPAPAVSPILKQFLDIKSKHPDALLLFRCGDFYVTYRQDAKKASEILGITLTKSSKTMDEQGKPLLMAGFPYHALDTYLPKLIRAGQRVAICDQLEAPKQTAKRGILELVSPGAAAEKEQKTGNDKVAAKGKTEDNREDNSLSSSQGDRRSAAVQPKGLVGQDGRELIPYDVEKVDRIERAEILSSSKGTYRLHALIGGRWHPSVEVKDEKITSAIRAAIAALPKDRQTEGRHEIARIVATRDCYFGRQIALQQKKEMKTGLKR